ncbi:UNVERIFIED_CONTAM: putative calcium-binding protein CML21 [Sesamum latifolium]|uniref:Calcium-binding protein CML21 n=1 Tax=Sesamum latifolium TaxID=2727402 RepID=A0AAW2WNV6_9LAMI
MGGVVGKNESPKAAVSETKLEARINEAIRRREVEGSTIKSFNSIILKFPKIDRSLRKCKATFEDFDEDGNGAIDREELKRCFHKVEINFTDERLMIYLRHEDPAAEHAKSRMGMLNLEATFETLVDAFVFLDKNKDGYNFYMIRTSSVQSNSNHAFNHQKPVASWNMLFLFTKITTYLFLFFSEEMDWDKNGMVNFKEFVFAFTRWVGIEEGDDDEGRVMSEQKFSSKSCLCSRRASSIFPPQSCDPGRHALFHVSNKYGV